jgi:alpha 1,2-mannosyltransferase
MILYFISSSSLPTSPIPGGTTAKTKAGTIPASSPAANNPAEKSDAAAVSSPAVSPNVRPGFPAPLSQGEKMNATFVTLARNSDLWDIVKSIRTVEDRFNKNFHYDWVFLNDKPFDAEFKRVTTAFVSGKTHYGEIAHEHWSFPDFIDQDKAAGVRKDMGERNIIYGDSTSYRHMCRFESGFFFRQPLMNQYEWYWRVEPSVELFCDVSYDPFKYMRDNNKKYSFVLSLYEYIETIETLWDSAKKFIKNHPEHIAKGNSMGWLSDDNGETYNRCHFVSSPSSSSKPRSFRIPSNTASLLCPVVQLRDRKPQLVALAGLHRLLRHARRRRRLLLRAMGRRPCPLYRRGATPQKRRNPFLRRHSLLPRSIHALSDGRKAPA